MGVEAISSGEGVESAIRRAAQTTGVDFAYLMKTARRESGLNPNARASTSSAAGLFQFVEQTWLQVLKRHGARYGLGAYADQVQTGGDGRLHVPDASARKAVLDLRLDPRTSALMAGELAQDHAAYLQGRMGRSPTAGELYAAHVLGPAGSAKLIEAVQSQPGASAANLFPEAADANAGLFYRKGRPVTVAELAANLEQGAHGGTFTAPAAVQLAAAPADSEAMRALALARRLDRVRRDEELASLLNGGRGAQGSGLGSLIDAQLMSVFVGRDKA